MRSEKKNFIYAGITALAVLCLFYCLTGNIVGRLFSAAAPIMIGGAAAYIINILAGFYERHYFLRRKKPGTARPVCALGAAVTIVFVVLLIVLLVVPQFLSCINTFVQKAPIAIETLLSNPQVQEILPADFTLELENIDWAALVSEVMAVLESGAAFDVAGTVSSLLSGVVTIFFSVIFAFYFLAGKEKIRRQCSRLVRNYLAPVWQTRVFHWAALFNDSFRKYITGQCMEAFLLGFLCFLGMSVFRLPYAAMVGAFVGMTALIPVVGGYIGAAVGAFMILSVSPEKAILFLVFIVVLQQLEGNLIYPKVVGSSVGLPAIMILAVVAVAGALFGIAGMLIGVPVASAVYRGIREDMEKKEQCRRAEGSRNGNRETGRDTADSGLG